MVGEGPALFFVHVNEPKLAPPSAWEVAGTPTTRLTLRTHLQSIPSRCCAICGCAGCVSKKAVDETEQDREDREVLQRRDAQLYADYPFFHSPTPHAAGSCGR